MHRTPNPGVGGSSPPRPAVVRQENEMIEKIKKYISEVSQEVSKVSWPSREELYGSVLVVLVLCITLSLFIFGVDFLLNRLLGVIF